MTIIINNIFLNNRVPVAHKLVEKLLAFPATIHILGLPLEKLSPSPPTTLAQGRDFASGKLSQMISDGRSRMRLSTKYFYIPDMEGPFQM